MVLVIWPWVNRHLWSKRVLLPAVLVLLLFSSFFFSIHAEEEPLHNKDSAEGSIIVTTKLPGGSRGGFRSLRGGGGRGSSGRVGGWYRGWPVHNAASSTCRCSATTALTVTALGILILA